MLIENLRMQRRLQRVVTQLSGDPDLRQELIQEAMIHLWRMEERDPGRDEAWYLRGCRFHLQNLLRQGRSVDSLRHVRARVCTREQKFDSFNLVELVDSNGSLRDEVGINDLMAELFKWLPRQEKDTLLCLIDGLSARQTA
jgi:DNA-directed RNA polymerase specialized sigma24 family protein